VSNAPWTFLPDLIEEHLEEIQVLWPIRHRGLRSAHMTLRNLRSLEDRIEAHADGVLVPGELAYPFIERLLESDDEHAAFAATFVLLRLGTEQAIGRVRRAIDEATGKRLTGIGRALQVGRAAPLLDDLGTMFRGDDSARAVAAAEVLCYHVRWKGSHDRLLDFLSNENPLVKQAGWRVVANLGIPIEPKQYAAAMRDDDAGVREAALRTAAWTGVAGALNIARAAMAAPAKDQIASYRILAALAEPGDLATIQTLVGTPALGPDRFALAASFGHPALAPVLLEHLSAPDKRDAIAAGEAFSRLTGADLGPGEQITLPPEDGSEPDEFEKEFLDTGTMPDPAKARAHWDRVGPTLMHLTRIAHGRDISTTIPADAYSWLDMQARYEYWMRARFRGTWSGTPMQLEVFPQR
jgi:uncharacterized protein (TIGR02270 family)